ncbi:MAG: hypothetical protein RM049_01965 [Nostoc sp. DedQUE04]|uniref:hypothetical protein n=1 Tax=Nostoc sp. DedQUE04 TaxID=3075390 RepID=UPI002AD511A9|nr:hypothetical protein [Nostoc sp. DedQUE04]MDZ8134051.1 hypothetical protein [Nostoc sp. DedQUE04]
MSLHFQAFHCPCLSNYKFYTSGWDYPEQICGYDRQGHSWRGEELLAMREQGLIIKECPEKTVVVGDKVSLLGYIRECLDGTWLAHSCYSFGHMDMVEVSGFKKEFYAVRYLHQVMDAAFPDTAYDPIPELPWQHKKLVQEQPEKAIFLEQLNALIGYIQECYKGIWSAYSCYYPKSMNALKLTGFISEFYAVRYLYQIAEVAFPDIIQDIPNLPWE